MEVYVHRRHDDAIIFQPALFDCSCSHHSLRNSYFLLLPSTSIIASPTKWNPTSGGKKSATATTSNTASATTTDPLTR